MQEDKRVWERKIYLINSFSFRIEIKFGKKINDIRFPDTLKNVCLRKEEKMYQNMTLKTVTETVLTCSIYAIAGFHCCFKKEMTSWKMSSLQGIVRLPIEWVYPNSSSDWLSKSWNISWFKYDIGIINRFFWIFPT